MALKTDDIEKNAKKLFDVLSSKGHVDVGALSQELGISKLDIWELASYLEENRKDITLVGNKKEDVIYLQTANLETPASTVPIRKVAGTYKIGVISDTRLGSKYQSLTPLYAAYALFENADVDFVVHAGHVFAGRQDKSRLGEMFIKDPDEQVDYAEAIFPKIKGVKTYMLSAHRDHSFSGKEGFRDLVKELTGKRSRPDLAYAGSDWRLRITDTDTSMRIMHPVDEAAPRGKSYGLQTIMEEIGNFIRTVNYGRIMHEKTNNLVLILGGYHIPIHIPKHAGLTAGISLPSLYTQSPFLRKRKISPIVGSYILELGFDKKRELENGGLNAMFLPLDSFIEKYDYFEKPRKKTGLDEIDDKILETLRMDLSVSYGDLSRRLSLNKDEVKKRITKLKSVFNTKEKTVIASPEDEAAVAGKKIVYYPDYAKKFSTPPMDFKAYEGKPLRVLGISDTHLGSRTDDASIKRLKEAYKIAEDEKCSLIVHSGDLTDGPGCTGYRGHINDAKFVGTDELVEYVAEVYPKSKIKTKMINGNHDDWIWRNVGHDLVKSFALRRPDIDYLGRLFQSFEQDGNKFTLIHGEGGSGYTLTTVLQKLLRYVLEYETDTNIMDVGNYHKAVYMYCSGVHCYSNPTMEYPGDFQKTRGIPEFIGFWLREYTRDKEGKITSVSNRYFDQKNVK